MTTHPDDGMLRAHLDRELAASAAAEVAAHLAACPECAARADAMSERAARVTAHLEALAPAAETAAVTTPEKAHARLAAQENKMATATAPRSEQRSARRRRALWAGLAAAAAVVALFTIPPLRAIAFGFLGLFRVEQVAVAPVNPSDMPEHLGSSAQLEALLSDQVQVESNGEPAYVVDPGQAAAAAGFDVRLPSLLASPDELAVQPAAHAALRVDLARVRAVLREIDRDAAELPAEIDGAQIEIDIPKSVRACWGDCPELEEHAAGRAPGAEPHDREGAARDSQGVILVQLPSPAVTAPPGLPIDRVGAAFLEIMGMPRAEAARFSQNVDWATTLVIPIPRHSSSYQEVTVDGVPGTLIRHSERLSYLLIWAKDGILYSLAGSGEAARGLEIANSLR